MASLPGLYRGTVEAGTPDPDDEFRVLVALADRPDAPVWARVAQAGASPGSDAGFFPEAGDEVVVGMLGGDPGEPVVLGGLYGRSRPRVASPDEADDRKAIVSRAGLRIDFDENERVLSIATPAGRTLRLDDETGQISLGDSGGNMITMGKGGVAISTAGDLRIDCAGELSAKAKCGIALAGLTIKADADASIALHGSAEAKLTSSARVTVQGGLVLIN